MTINMNIQPDGRSAENELLKHLRNHFRCVAIDAEMRMSIFSAHAEIIGDFVREFYEKLN